jgi:hypothetical protein
MIGRNLWDYYQLSCFQKKPVGQESYIMLNGGDGDFCLQLKENENKNTFILSLELVIKKISFQQKGENINLYNWKRTKS